MALSDAACGCGGRPRAGCSKARDWRLHDSNDFAGAFGRFALRLRRTTAADRRLVVRGLALRKFFVDRGLGITTNGVGRVAMERMTDRLGESAMFSAVHWLGLATGA